MRKVWFLTAAPEVVRLSEYELGLVLLSALLHASWNAATKGSKSPTAFLLTMEAASLVLYLPVLIFGFRMSDLPPGLWVWIAGSALVHAFYAYWLSRGYTHGDLSLVYPIARSTPAFVPLVAVPLMGESVSLMGALGIGLVVAGMWAIQTDGKLQLRSLVSVAAVFAYLTLLTTVAYSLIDKQAMLLLDSADWAGRAPRALVYMGLFELAYVPLFYLLAARSLAKGEFLRVARSEWRTASVGAVFGITSYVLILEAMRTAPVSYVVAVRQSSVLFAVGLGMFFLRERPGRVRVIGTLATLAGVALISLYS